MSGVLPKVYLVRHGETAWTLSGQHTGRTDIPLTERGEHAARELGARLKGMSFTKVLTSPLQRARRTGELAGFDERMEPDPDLMEWDYGDYEGRRTLDIRAERPGWRLFEHGCPGGETLVDVSTRLRMIFFAQSESPRETDCAKNITISAAFARSQPQGWRSVLPPDTRQQGTSLTQPLRKRFGLLSELPRTLSFQLSQVV